MSGLIDSKFESTKDLFNGLVRQLFSHPEIVGQTEELALRRDIITLLEFVRDNKVIGTQTTGNMPLRTVRKVTARFVEPPKLETTVGDHTYRLRSEADLWSLYFLHILAEVGGLLAIAPGRRWRLTSQGKKFLETEALFQVMFLFSTWWNEIDWLVAYPLEGMGEALPPDFDQVTLALLRSLPVGNTISFEGFADDLIERAGLSWNAKGSRFATLLLRGSIERMVINILETFGGVMVEYREEPLGKGTISELDAFQVTPLGKAELDAAAIMSG